MGVITVKPSDGVIITDNSVKFPINDTYCDKTYEVTYTDTENKCKCKRTVVQQSLSCSNSTTFATGYTSGSTNVCTAHTVTLTVPPQQYTAYTRTRVDCDTCSETSSTGITNSYNITVEVSEYTGSGTRIVSGRAGYGNNIYYKVSQSGGCVTCPESSTTYGSTSFTASVHCSATSIFMYVISNVPYTSVTYTRSSDGRKCNSTTTTGKEDIYVNLDFTNEPNTGTTNKIFTGTVPDYPNISYKITQLAEEACYCCENFSVKPEHYSFSAASTQLGTCGVPSCDIPTGNVRSVVVEDYYTTSALTETSTDRGWLHDLCYVYDSEALSSPYNRFKGKVDEMPTSYSLGKSRWAKVTATYNCNGGTGTYSWPVGQFFVAPS